MEIEGYNQSGLTLKATRNIYEVEYSIVFPKESCYFQFLESDEEENSNVRCTHSLKLIIPRIINIKGMRIKPSKISKISQG